MTVTKLKLACSCSLLFDCLCAPLLYLLTKLLLHAAATCLRTSTLKR